MERKTGKQMAEELTNFINSSGLDENKEFVETLMREHRTLQDDTFRLFIKAIHGWSEQYDSGNYDGRNETACKLSKKIVDAVF